VALGVGGWYMMLGATVLLAFDRKRGNNKMLIYNFLQFILEIESFMNLVV